MFFHKRRTSHRYLVLGVILAFMIPALTVSAAPMGFTPQVFGDCGDGTCDTGDGEDSETCPSDCSVFIGGYCGDGTCNEGEKGACPEDCGIGCIESTCAEGEYFDWDLCSCQSTGDTCLPQTCPANQIFDTNLCQCITTAYCGDGNCDAGENSDNCVQDCGTPIPLTYCGDGNCDEDENYNVCAQDCPPPAPPVLCGDGTCDASSENYKSCPFDCPAPNSSCGDGFCDLTFENLTDCPQDCTANVCGNGTCDTAHGENSQSCPSDCAELPAFVCGDSVCETNLLENHANCPNDCLVTCGNAVCEYTDTGVNSDMMNQGLQPIHETRKTCPADCVPNCGNSKCETTIGEDVISCPNDCGTVCGDGQCDISGGVENQQNCPKDCGFCGNGICEPTSGEDLSTCFTDCEPARCKNYTGHGSEHGYKPLDCPAACGNGFCDSLYGETYASCPADCKPVCGDFRCDLDYGETYPNCPTDCTPTCGDRVCDHTKETVISCPADCPLSALSCDDDKCDPGEAVACPECWALFDHRCEFGEGSYFRSPDCYTVHPGCSCYEWTAKHSGSLESYHNLAMTYNKSVFSIPLSPLLLVSMVIFMRSKRSKQFKEIKF